MKFFSSLLVGLCTLVVCVTTPGQWHPALQHTTVKLGNIDSVDLDTLNIQLSFPVINKAARGINIHFGITYSGNFWLQDANYLGNFASASTYGWNFEPMIPVGSFYEQEYEPVICRQADSTNDPLYTRRFGSRTYVDQLGISHQFLGDREYSECTDSETQSYPAWTSLDGYTVSSLNYVYDPSGRQVATADVTDANGNRYVPGYGTDTSGTIPLSVTGLDGTRVAASTVIYTYHDAIGSEQHITVNFGTYNVRTSFGNGSGEKTGNNAKLPQSIVYPEGTYEVTYEDTPGYPGSTTGRIRTLKLPTGGTITYSYNGTSVNRLDGSTSYFTRTTSDGTTTFTRTASNPDRFNVPQDVQVVVQPPSGNSTTYAFSSTNYTASNEGFRYIPTSINDGVSSKSICYITYADDGCTTSNLQYVVTGRETTTTLDNGQQQFTKETFNLSGMVTEMSVYDLSGTTQTLLQKRKTDYKAFNNIQNRPESVTISDATGTVSTTTYGYNEYPLASTSDKGLSGRWPVFGDRDNLTTITYNGSLTEHFWYDDTGQVVEKEDVANKHTTYGYDPTNSFVTSTSLPSTVSGVSLSLGAAYDAGSGLITSRTDANGHTTKYDYDGSLRRTATSRDTASGGDGSIVERQYTSSNQVSTTSSNGSGGTADTEQIADGYGREVRTARKIVSSSGKPWVVTDTCYDADGRQSFKSLPYTAANLTGEEVCSGSGDQFTYDGIGRLQKITHADQSTVDYLYKGRSTKVTEESHGAARTARITQMDGLGRLSKVCELTGQSLDRGGHTYTPQSCGLDIDSDTAIGFLTTYAYDPSGHTTTSTQGDSSYKQTRTWVTDAFGRPTSETVPELFSQSGSTQGVQGVTTYAYEYNSTGLKVTRSKPKANFTTGSEKTYTITQFDALGRPESISYRNGSASSSAADEDTPDVAFTYDASSAGNAKNVKGRLVSASSSRGSTWYSYSPTGQVIGKADSLPGYDGGSSALCTFSVQTYSYDLLGNLLESNDNVGGSKVTNTYDTAANPKDVTATPAGGSATTILSSLTYDAYGLSGVQFGNNWQAQIGFDSRGRLDSFATKSGGVTLYSYGLTWNKNGSLASAADSVNGSWTYGYDDMNRMVSAAKQSGENTTYQYDVFGNRYPVNNGSGGGNGVGTFTYDVHNHNSLFSYDEAGNAISTPQVDSDYDAEGRVVRVRSHGSTTASAAYVYGPEGNRVMAVRGSRVTEYFYGAAGELRVARLNGTVIKAPVETSLGEVGSFVGTDFRYEFRDWNGSTRLAVSSGSQVIKQYQSDAFGAGSNATTEDIAQVNELEVDVEASSQHAGARDYYPSFGTWNAPDPYSGSYDFNDPQSLNRYGYVSNNPVSYTDSSGLARWGNLWEGDGFTYSGGASWGSGSWEDTEATRECKSWLCTVTHLPGLLVSGLGHLGSYLASNAGGGSYDPRDFARFASATSGGTAGHPAAQATNASDNNYTFTLNRQNMSALVGPHGEASPAFSGLESERNDPSKTGDAAAGPLPIGSYYIVDRPSGGRAEGLRDIAAGTSRKTWFALFRVDDQIDDHTFVDGVQRSNFRLHPKGPLGLSEGCITINSLSNFVDLAFRLMSARPANIPGTSIRYYGTVTVR